MDNAPLYEREIAGEQTTIRVTVDITTDGEVFAFLAVEPTEGDLRQSIYRIDARDWDALIAMIESGQEAMDRALYPEEYQDGR